MHVKNLIQEQRLVVKKLKTYPLTQDPMFKLQIRPPATTI